MNPVEYIISLRDKNFTSGIKNAKKSVSGLDSKMDSLNKRTSSLTNGLRSVAAAAALFTVGSEIINTVSEFEKYDAVLTNTFQSQEKSRKSLAQITDFASKTPFQVNKLTESYVKLVNQGFIPTTKQLTKLGDLASSTGKDFGQLTEAILDAQTGEFERLKEFGIKASKEGKKVSFSFKGVKKTVDNTGESIRGYLLSLGGLTGVSGAMAAISKTLGGKISNLKDRLTQLFLSIGQKLKPAIEQIINFFNKGILTISKLIGYIDKSKLGFDGLVTVIAIMTTAISAWIVVQKIINILLFANPIGIVIVALTALVALIVVAYKHSETFRGVLGGLFNVFIKIYNYLKAKLMPVFSVMGQIFVKIGGYIKDYIVNKINLAINAFKKLIGFLSKIPGVGKLIQKVKDGFNQGFSEGVKDFRKEQDKISIKDKIEGLIPSVGDGIGSSRGGVGRAISSTKENKVTSSAPKQFNINIETLGDIKLSTTNITEGASEIKKAIQKALLESLADLELAR